MATPKTKKVKKQAQVFCVPSDESSSGKHEVIFAADGDLNEAARRGDIRKFSKWDDAEGFAHKKGEELKAKVMIHSYRQNPTYTTNYERKRLPTRKLPRITPKRPRLRR